MAGERYCGCMDVAAMLPRLSIHATCQTVVAVVASGGSTFPESWDNGEYFQLAGVVDECLVREGPI